MFCPGCGQANPDAAQFCGSCGNALVAPSEAVKPPPPEETTAEIVDLDTADEPVSSGLKWGVVVATLFLPIIGIGMGLYFLFSGDSQSKKSVGKMWLIVGLGMVVLAMLLSGGY